MEESSNLLVTQPAACSKITYVHFREQSGFIAEEKEREVELELRKEQVC